MKIQHLLILLSFIVASSSFGQGLNFQTSTDEYNYSPNIFDTILVNQTWNAFSAPEAINAYAITLIPTEGEPLAESFRMELKKNTIPTEWDYFLCNNDVCFIENTWPDYETIADPSGHLFYLTGYDTWDIKIYPNSVPDTAEVVVYIYKNQETVVADSLYLTFRYTENTTSASVLQETNILEIYPNPASDIVKLKIQDAADIRRASIIDMSGRIIKSVDIVNNESISINLLDVRKGIYILRCDGNNAIPISKKLVVN